MDQKHYRDDDHDSRDREGNDTSTDAHKGRLDTLNEPGVLSAAVCRSVDDDLLATFHRNVGRDAGSHASVRGLHNEIPPIVGLRATPGTGDRPQGDEPQRKQ